MKKTTFLPLICTPIPSAIVSIFQILPCGNIFLFTPFSMKLIIQFHVDLTLFLKKKKKTPYLFRLFCMCTCKIMMWMVCMYMNPIIMIPQCAIHAADSSTTMFSIPHFPLSPFVKLSGTFHKEGEKIAQKVTNTTKNTFQYQIFV